MVSLKSVSWKVYMKILLQLIALHSLLVGILLIFLPANFFEFFGYAPISENFFRAQGGVFHIVMVFAYFMASLDVKKSSNLIRFIILTKFTATVFLVIYYLDRMILLYRIRCRHNIVLYFIFFIFLSLLFLTKILIFDLSNLFF